MDDEVRSRLFEPFYTTRETGRGIGLAEVHDLIVSMQGAITVDSAPDQGAVFTVCFPVADGVDAVPVGGNGDGVTRAGALAPIGGDGLVLLADDEPHLLKITAMLLDRMGFNVLVASNGKEAVAHFREQRAAIQAVLLDAEMPEMSGIEAFRIIRELDEQVPVVMISGHPEVELANAFDIGRPDMVLLKPVAVEALRNSLASVLTAAGRAVNG